MKQALTLDFETVFQDRGLRATHQRLEIFKALTESKDHPSAETLYGDLRKKMPTISLDTIYRNLHIMETHGLIIRVVTGQSQARFEANLSPHHHLICKICHTITDILWIDFDSLKIPQKQVNWGRMDSKQATITGICRNCLDNLKQG